MISVLFVLFSGAYAQVAKNCVLASKSAITCCQNPLGNAAECLDDESKALNAKLQAYQETLARPSGGLKDASREARQQAQALKDSAALNLRLATACESLSSRCFMICTPLKTSDAKAALGRCEENVKLAQGMKAQAERDAAAAKRADRPGLK